MKVERRRLFNFVIKLLYGIISLWKWSAQRIRLTLFHRRDEVIDYFADKDISDKKKERLLIVVAHYVTPQTVTDQELFKVKADRLEKTLEGIWRSFSDYELKVMIHTMKGCEVLKGISDFHHSKINVNEEYEGDPMCLEFCAQEEFIRRKNDHDWFLAIEDDIVIQDSLFIKKYDFFNRSMKDPHFLLMPHRFEMCRGEKVYFDLAWKGAGKSFHWNRFSRFIFEGIHFGECGNPHGGMYLLNRVQLDLWEKSGRFWNNRVTWVGHLESAMTGCLYESFTVMKAHLQNLSFLEVQHWDQKYAPALKDINLQKEMNET